jgi:hypothetical protein
MQQNINNSFFFQPVYVDTLPHFYRSSSCPNFTFDIEPRGPAFKRKRANSENIHLSAKDMLRIQSDTDLLGIDKEKTFTASAIVKPAELLARVVNALGGLEPQPEKGINIFDDDHILASENPPMFSIGQNLINGTPIRNRAFSVDVPTYRKDSATILDQDVTWPNGETGEKYRSGKLSLPTHIPLPPMENISQPRSLFQRLFKKSSSTESPTEYNNDAGSGTQDNKAKGRRGSMFPSFNFGGSNKTDEDVYKEKTKQGRRSIFPTFDFSEDEEKAKAYQQKPKRHSIFPTFDFSEDEDEKAAKAYRERTNSGRRSIFPTFDFSESEDDSAKRYKEKTSRGRHSIFPTFDFSESESSDNDSIDEEELKKYQNRTKKGRLSLFPTFGRSKKSDDEAMPESSDELVEYKNKTNRGRLSLFPTFGKDRKTSAGDAPTDLEASIREYQKKIKQGRNSLFVGDLDDSRKDNSFARELESYRNKTKRGRGSLFDPDVNIAELPQSEQVKVLEQTSVADLIRALAVLETASQSTKPPGLLDLVGESSATPTRRRGSLRPDFTIPTLPTREETEDAPGPRRRRISARAAAPHYAPSLQTVVAGSELQITAAAARENRMTMLSPPPPYSETEGGSSGSGDDTQKPKTRRYSSTAGESSRPSTGPVPRLFSRMRKESVNLEEGNARRGSLTDIVVETNKDNT